LRFSPSLIAAAMAASMLFSSTLNATASPVKTKKSSRSGAPKPAAAPRSVALNAPPAPINRSVPFMGTKVARQALSYRGVPYRFGGQSRKGIDCSALIQSAFKKWGILLPRTSVAQHQQGVAVPREQMKSGDLVFFKNTYRHGISHVGIYIGNNKFVHASSGKNQVTVSSLDNVYYRNHWAGARRVALDREPVVAAVEQPASASGPACAAGEPATDLFGAAPYMALSSFSLLLGLVQVAKRLGLDGGAARTGM
jgi:cell wall-associated NlpC family hydrolase